MEGIDPFRHPTFRCLSALVCLTAVLVVSCVSTPPDEHLLSIEDIRVRDPFVVAHVPSRTYYLYAQTGNRHGGLGRGVGVEVYRSQDLRHWSQPTLVYRKPPEFWGGNEIWAPEVHRFGNWWYLFVSFNGREAGRGTQILRATSPEGPFEHFSAHACTPAAQRCLDGTPFVDENGDNWMVYCHEWRQTTDGGMRAVRMAADWSRRIGDSMLLFTASQAPWVVNHVDDNPPGPGICYVTDGPYLHRIRTGSLLMLWSSFTGDGRRYAVGVAESESGRIQGPWRHHRVPLINGDGGHCMLFVTFDGQLMLTWHQPDRGGLERAHFQPVVERDGRLHFGTTP